MSYIIQQEKRYYSTAGPLKAIGITALGLSLIINSVYAEKITPGDEAMFHGAQRAISSLVALSTTTSHATDESTDGGLSTELRRSIQHQSENFDRCTRSWYTIIKDAFKGLVHKIMRKVGAPDKIADEIQQAFCESVLNIQNNTGKTVDLRIYQWDDREHTWRKTYTSTLDSGPWSSTLSDLQLDLSKTFRVEVSRSMFGFSRKDFLENLSCKPLSTKLTIETTRSRGLELCERK